MLGVQNFTTKDEFKESVREQNPLIKELIEKDSEFSIVFSKEPRNDAQPGNKYFQVVVRVSDEIRKVIKASDDKIFMGSGSYRVVDRFYIKRCNKCQQFGHYERDCTFEVQCAYCPHQHKSSECDQVHEGDFANYNCNNCKKAGTDPTGHSTHWHKCPSMLEQQKKAKRGIPYYSQKNY